MGTKKGAFILTSDEKRAKWKVAGPLFGGWEIYHIKGSPVDPNRIYASQTSSWFGQIIQRSDDGGRTWSTPGGEKMPGPTDPPVAGTSNRFVYDGEAGQHQWYDGSLKPWEFKRVWHLEPSLTDVETVYAGVEDAAMFRTTDGGKSWHELSGLRKHGTGPQWMPGAGGMCLHTILIDPTRHERMYIAISAAGAFRTDDGGQSWKAINQGLKSQYIPDPNAEVGHCVHRIAMHPSKPNTLFMQKHWDVMRSDNAGDSWHEVSGNLPSDFGFPIEVHAHEPETIYVVPILSDSLHYPPDGKLRVYRSKTGGNEWEALTKGLPQKNCYVNVLREATAVDTLDSCGVYFGTTGGQVYVSPDGGDTWKAIVENLPGVLSVEVQVLA
ncbi:MAG TPA: sialidase family protein [Kiritimatiellia bacterium]